MELNSLCLKCKNFKYHVFSQKVKVSKCEVGLNCKEYVVSCISYVPRYIDDIIPKNEKEYHCNTCKFSNIEYLDGVGFIDKCNNMQAFQEHLNNTMSIYKCKYYELDPEKLPIPKSILDLI